MALNVVDYGAQGDAVQAYVSCTSNSPIVVTTNAVSANYLGKVFQLFGAGTPTVPPDCQDMIATITNIVNGTNIYVNRLAGRTRANTFATWGHNNSPNFMAAIGAAGTNANVTINIPTGKYLFLADQVSANGTYINCGIVVTNAGLRFVGEGTNKTILVGPGAWQLKGGAAYRGALLVLHPPMINDYFTLADLTLDGGVERGMSAGSFPASVINGTGWDITHDAVQVGGLGNTATHQLWTNLFITRWRGEMVKSVDVSTNGNLNIFNCTFADGAATAINYYAALNISNCVFRDLFQVGEYYQQYSTNASYFKNSLITNITDNGWAWNGATGNNPPFYFQENTFYLRSENSAFLTTPGANLYIVSNIVNMSGGFGSFLSLGVLGYQSPNNFCNSNIVVAYNTVIDPQQFVYIVSAGAGNHSIGVQIYSNTVTSIANTPYGLNAFGAAKNVRFYANQFIRQSPNYDSSDGPTTFIQMASGGGGEPFARVDTDNSYWVRVYDFAGKTNFLSYANGSRFEVIYTYAAGTVWVLQDNNASQIPVGAQMLIKNNNTSATAIPVYLNSARTRGPIMVAAGSRLLVDWTNGVWRSAFNPEWDPKLRVIGPGP